MGVGTLARDQTRPVIRRVALRLLMHVAVRLAVALVAALRSGAGVFGVLLDRLVRLVFAAACRAGTVARDRCGQHVPVIGTRLGRHAISVLVGIGLQMLESV